MCLCENEICYSLSKIWYLISKEAHLCWDTDRNEILAAWEKPQTSATWTHDFYILEMRGNLSCKKNNVLNPSFRSYGSVFKAIHKESGQVVAIKQVPVESDLQEIIKEISIMQQCDR